VRTTAVAVAALALAAPAAAGVQIGGVDTSGYPDLRVTVLAPVGSTQPTLEENRLPVIGERAANLGRAKSVSLVVDRSQSMQGAALADAAAGARAFVAGKASADRVEVIGFGRRALALTQFSSSPVDANAALRGLATDVASGTALWDGIVLAAQRLQHEEQPGHVIIVLTDGQDVSSSHTFADAVAAAHRARASVYAIGIAGPQFTPAPLRELAAKTGGSYHQTASTSELHSLYASIASTLARSWQIEYATAGRPGETVGLRATVAGERSAVLDTALPNAGPSTARPAPPSGIVPKSAWGSPLAPLVLALVVGLLLLVAFGFAAAARSGMWLSGRLAPHLGPPRRRGKTRRRREPRTLLRGLFAATEHAFANVKQFRALQRLLTRADLPLLASELLYCCLGLALAVSALAALVGTPALLLVFLAAAIGALPVLFVMFKAGARIKAFDNQLPDLLITIAASLKAGHSFRHAIQAVVDEGAEPAAKEFQRVLTETRLGRPMDQALADMASRIGSKNLSFVLTAVTIQRQIGGSLAGLFDMVAETVRQRQQFVRKIRGLTAMGRMSAYVLAGLPFFIAFAVTVINPSYMEPLWGTQTGHQLIAMGLGMIAFGGLILKKIVSFKG
jgi:tight adherence protein B